MKINFHNPYAVYMHDTPQQNLFFEEVRFESSGCVRVQNIHQLALWILRDNPEWNRQRLEQTVDTREMTIGRSRVASSPTAPTRYRRAS